jgi:hypothetical protein
VGIDIGSLLIVLELRMAPLTILGKVSKIVGGNVMVEGEIRI